MSRKLVVDCTTGEQTEVDMEPEEQVAYDRILAERRIVYTERQTITRRATSTGTAPVELLRVTLQPLSGASLFGDVYGVETESGFVRRMTASVVAKRLYADAVLVGGPAVVANHADPGAAGWAINAAVDGNDFVATVAGSVGQSVDWMLSATVTLFASNGLEGRV